MNENGEFSEQPTQVLDFWFGKSTDEDYLEPKSFWYANDEDDDNLVEEHLGDLYELAATDQLDHWMETPNGCIALIILLDQVPRNIFRGLPRQFDTDSKALDVAKKVVDNGWDKNQPDIIRRYIYSPFNHSENLSDQEVSVELFEDLGDPEHIYWAKNFYRIIKQSGRFPHRDQILGRKNLRIENPIKFYRIINK